MKKHIVILVIIILFIVVGITGCFDSDNKELKKFVGTWKHGTLPDGGSITFFSDGTGIYKNEYAEWKIENAKLIIYLPNRDETLKFNYEFLDDNLTLILTDEADHIDDYRKL